MQKLLTPFFAASIASLPLSAMAQLPPYVPEDDLVGWWPFSGNANDVSGNGHNGTAYSATITDDRFGEPGSAYAFNGTDAYIEVPDAPALRLNNDSYTIAWWAWVDTYNANATAFVVKRGSGSQNGWMVVANGLYDNKIEMKTSSGADPEIRCDTAVASGAWFHFAIVNDTDADSIIFFANGIEVFRQSNGGLYYNPNSTSPMRFGSDTSTPAGTYYLSGAMDDIGIWSRGLTAQEVLDLYLNTNVSVEETPETAAEVYFDAATEELVLRVPLALIENTYSVLDSGGRVVRTGSLQSSLTRRTLREVSGLYMVRFDARSGDAVRVVIP